MEEYKLYINGKFVDSVSNKTFESIDPTTEEPWAKIAEAQSADVDPDARIEKLHELQRFILDNVLVGINMPVPGHSYIVYNKRLRNFPEDDYLLGSLFMRNHDMWIAS